MTGPTRPPSGGAPRQPWSPERARAGVTCPACGLTNEDGARVCRNCGLPIASADDPVRGVAPGRVVMPSTQRSGLSATLGLAMVVGLLLIAGTLAVSGGGILNSGGRLGVEAAESAAPGAEGDEDAGSVVGTPSPLDFSDEDAAAEASISTSFDFTCDDDAIKDLSSRRWKIKEFRAGSRLEGGYDQIAWEMSPAGKKKAKAGTIVTMRWFDDTSEARSSYGAPERVQGSRAIVVTFEGPAQIDVNQAMDALFLAPENITQIRNIQMFEGSDGNVHTIVGLRSQSCARMEAKGWAKKSKSKLARVLLQIERPD